MYLAVSGRMKNANRTANKPVAPKKNPVFTFHPAPGFVLSMYGTEVEKQVPKEATGLIKLEG